MFCWNCGKEFVGNSCPYCGAPAHQSQQGNQQPPTPPPQNHFHHNQEQNQQPGQMPNNRPPMPLQGQLNNRSPRYIGEPVGWNNGNTMYIPPKPAFYKQHPIVFVLLIVLAFVIVAGALGSLIKDHYMDSNQSNLSQQIELKEEYINSCQEYDYKELLRNPNNYIDKKMFFSGRVLDVSESGDKVTFRIDLYPDELGTDGHIRITYNRKDDGEPHILNDDVVTIYGTFQGTEKAYNILLNEITMPKIKAEYVIIDE